MNFFQLVRERMVQLAEPIHFNKIMHTEPIVSDDSAAAEIVMLLSNKDLIMAFCALKSLCFFARRNFKITLIADDGCLRPEHVRQVRDFVHNATLILDRVVMAERVKLYPMCREFLFDDDPTVSKLLGPLVYSTKDKLILMDSDVCFFGYPRAMVEWLNGNDKDCLYLSGKPPKWASDELKAAVAREFELTLPLVTCDTGLLLFYREAMDLDVLEAVFKIQKEYGYTQWTKELFAYGVLIQRYGHYRQLPPEYTGGSAYGATGNHYLSRYQHTTHARLKIRGMIEYILYKEKRNEGPLTL